MKAVRAGQLRHRVALQRPVSTRNSFGEVTLAWETYAERWAAVEPISGRERLLAAQVQAQLTHRVLLRPLDVTVSPRDQVAYRGRVLKVEAVRDLEERGRLLVLDCREEVLPSREES